MSIISEIPLSIIGKDSFLPFAGMFFAKHYSQEGWCHIVGRFYEADITNDFINIRKFEQRLRSCLKACSDQNSRDQLQGIWKVAREEKLFDASISTMVSVVYAQKELLLAGFGISGLWGNMNKDKQVWFPLLPDSHPLFEEEKLPKENPYCLMFSSHPQHILVRPKPALEGLSSNGSIAKRIFEVSR